MSEIKKVENATPGMAHSDSGATGLEASLPKGSGPAGIVPDPQPSANIIHVVVDQMPQYPGDMNDYLSKNIQYPEAARGANVQGRVAVQFVVNEDGTISNAKVIRQIGAGCDEEALRVIRSMPKWKPGKNNGIPVKVLFTQPIVFKLDQ